MGRLGDVLFAIGGLTLGLAGGCGIICNCPPVDPFVEGVFSVVDGEDDGVVEGEVVAEGDLVTLDYVDENGDEWLISWIVESKT